MQDRRLIEARKLGHVLDFVEFRWIHFLYVVFEDEGSFAGFGQLHLDFIVAVAFDAGCHETLGRVQICNKLITRWLHPFFWWWFHFLTHTDFTHDCDLTHFYRTNIKQRPTIQTDFGFLFAQTVYKPCKYECKTE